MNEHEQLIRDAAIMTEARNLTCVLCNKKHDDGGYPVIIANRVYCRVCWQNGRHLIENL